MPASIELRTLRILMLTATVLLPLLITSGCSGAEAAAARQGQPRRGTAPDSSDDRGSALAGSKKRKKKKKVKKAPAKSEATAKADSDESKASREEPKPEEETAAPPAVVEPVPPPLVYPSLKFVGTGYSTYELREHLATRMEQAIEIDTETLHSNTTVAKVQCGGLRRCNQAEVDQSTDKNSLGDNVFARVSVEKLKKLKAEGFQIERGLLFATGLKSKHGRTFTFEPPIPVYAWPAPGDAYKDLQFEPSWSAKVTVSDKLVPVVNGLDENNLPPPKADGTGQVIDTFNITVIAKLADSGGEDLVGVTLEVTIPEDKNRLIYEALQLPRTATFFIDSEKRNIMRTEVTIWYNGDRSGGPEESVMKYGLCSKKQGEKEETFPCE